MDRKREITFEKKKEMLGWINGKTNGSSHIIYEYIFIYETKQNKKSNMVWQQKEKRIIDPNQYTFHMFHWLLWTIDCKCLFSFSMPMFYFYLNVSMIFNMKSTLLFHLFLFDVQIWQFFPLYILIWFQNMFQRILL